MGGAIVIDNTNPSGRVPKKSKPSPTSSFDRRSAELMWPTISARGSE
ncbi:hypothetical protein PENARI_c004G01843 [Penicillium arizonense]|uniref:Uncharacterized protein n=1 Tax=Penicillium arizonense TaxID=1835702 RepID=A0A1F5LQB5_PENAI|nr:hypothetical protein PENARI_c004G01843 [Penicillium arizonense]OGE55404.1 hypothetical protein PENARI_c004G01843 [Penicillium arizonense]